MTRSTHPLHRHLLLRSDLANLQVPAGEVVAWLANGWLEQVGSLPGREHDPVFAVPSNRLRQELGLRLLPLGKPMLLLTPARVRSFLLRALMASSDDPGALAQDLACVLEEIAAEVAEDVEAVLRQEDAPAAARRGAGVCFDAEALLRALEDSAHSRPPAADRSPEPVLRDEEPSLASREAPAAPTSTTGTDLRQEPPMQDPFAEDAPGGAPVPSTTAAPAAFGSWPEDPDLAPSPTPAATAWPEDAAPAPDATLPTAAPAGAPIPATAPPADLAPALGRIESVLGTVHETMRALAADAASSAVDLAPLTQAVRTAFARVADQLAAIDAAVAAVAERVDALGAQLADNRQPAPAAQPTAADPCPPTVSAGRRAGFTLLGAAAALATSLLVWVQTGSAGLSTGVLVGAMALGVALRSVRRRASRPGVTSAPTA